MTNEINSITIPSLKEALTRLTARSENNVTLKNQQDELLELAQNVGFSTNAFMLFGLPTKRLEENSFIWKKENPFCELTLSRHPKFEIPWGCYARINQIFIDTEIKKTGSNVLHLGNCFNDYVKKLGYKEGGANKALLKQLINYLTLRIDIEPKKNWNNSDYKTLNLLQTLISSHVEISFDVKNPDQMFLKDSFVLLDEKYAAYVHKTAVPLNLNIIEHFKNNPLALDFFRFLAYRNNDLNREISFPDKTLFEQFGSDIENIRVTRFKCKKILEEIKKVWPVQARFEDETFILKPSEPCVKKLPPTPKMIINQLKPAIVLDSSKEHLLEKVIEKTGDEKSRSYLTYAIQNSSEFQINLALEDFETYLISGRKIKNKGAFFVQRLKHHNPKLKKNTKF
jgi:hypothetical protein